MNVYIAVIRLNKTMIKPVKTTVVVHDGIKRHDSKIIPLLMDKLMRSFTLRSARTDMGYGDKKVRKGLRNREMRPLIKHRLFSSLQTTWTPRFDTKEHERRLLWSQRHGAGSSRR
ncbi:hypothetical protein IG206_01860 [Candidatus Parvarchaeota archaeon]|nr:hypothetical protein [Candidatus Acidifodinimicrobium mancum]